MFAKRCGLFMFVFGLMSGLVHGGVMINFDSLPAEGLTAGLSGPLVTDYLAGFGISISGVTPGSQVSVYDSRVIYADIQPVQPSSKHNVIVQVGSNDPVQYRLNFSQPQDYFAFTRPAIRSGVTGIALPLWNVSAFDSFGNMLGSVGEGPRSIFSDIPEARFTLNGPDISSVVVAANNFHFAALSSMVLDDFEVSSVPSVTAVPEPSTLAVFGALMLPAVVIRRQRPNARNSSAIFN